MRHYTDSEYQAELDALANRCGGPKGRESLAVRQMVRDAIESRQIDPRTVQLAAGASTFQLDPDDVFNIRGEARALRFKFNTLTVVYGVSLAISSSGATLGRPDVWLFDLQRSQRNAIGQPNNRVSLSAFSGPDQPTVIQPLYGEYKVDWTGSLLMDDVTARMPQTVERFTVTLHGIEVWKQNGPILANG